MRLQSRFVRSTLWLLLTLFLVLAAVVVYLGQLSHEQRAFQRLEQLRHSRSILLETNIPSASWRLLQQRLPDVVWQGFDEETAAHTLGTDWEPVRQQLVTGASSWQGVIALPQGKMLAQIYHGQGRSVELLAIPQAVVRQQALAESLVHGAILGLGLFTVWLAAGFWLRHGVVRPLRQLGDELLLIERGKEGDSPLPSGGLEITVLSGLVRRISSNAAAELRQRSVALLRQQRDAGNQRALVAMLETSLDESPLTQKLERVLALLAERIEHPVLMAARVTQLLPEIQVLAERGDKEALAPVGADDPIDEFTDAEGWQDHSQGRRLRLALTDRDQTIGYLDLLQAKEGELPDEHFLRSVAHIIAAVWQRSQQATELQRRALQLRAVIDHVADGLVVHCPRGKIVRVNQTLARLSGYRVDELLGMRLADLVEATEQGADKRLLLRHRQGRRIAVELSTARFGADGQALEVSLVRDISQRLDAERQLRMLSQVVEQSPVAVVITDTQGVIEYVNPRFCRDSGYRPLELIGKHSRMLRSGLTPHEVYRSLWGRLSQGASWRGELCNRNKSGELFWERMLVCPLSDGKRTTHFLALKENITTERAQRQQLFEQTHFDQLTGLPNRTQALDRLELLIEGADKDQKTALMLLDLDHFKGVNESLGHGAGDQLLVAVSQRLREEIAEPAMVARLGGDEFAVICRADADQAKAVAERLLTRFQHPFHVDDQHLFVNLSIGVAVYPQDGIDAMTLLRHAEAAMHLAKSQGRGRLAAYEAEMNLHAQRRLVMETELRFALERDELRLHFQPQVAANGRVVGAEAMLRWESTRLGPVAPDTFIPLAEKLGLIADMGDWALRHACEQAVNWQDDPLMPQTVAVNVSACQLAEPDFLVRVQRALDETGLAPERLELEITESILLGNDQQTIERLQQLHRRGIQLSLDDFGTGYSALSYLQRYPFDSLKVDRSFVHAIDETADGGQLIRAIVSLAKSLSLKVVAEGVETPEQLEFVHNLGCDLVQGFYYAGPQSVERLRSYLKTHHQRHSTS